MFDVCSDTAPDNLCNQNFMKSVHEKYVKKWGVYDKCVSIGNITLTVGLNIFLYFYLLRHNGMRPASYRCIFLLPFDPEDGGHVSLGRFCWLSPDCAALYPRRQNFHT
jgi:hypothetical protein